jgi:hypothetical protein
MGARYRAIQREEVSMKNLLSALALFAVLNIAYSQAADHSVTASYSNDEQCVLTEE